jgi:hypothetical protein
MRGKVFDDDADTPGDKADVMGQLHSGDVTPVIECAQNTRPCGYQLRRRPIPPDLLAIAPTMKYHNSEDRRSTYCAGSMTNGTSLAIRISSASGAPSRTPAKISRYVPSSCVDIIDVGPNDPKPP